MAAAEGKKETYRFSVCVGLLAATLVIACLLYMSADVRSPAPPTSREPQLVTEAIDFRPALPDPHDYSLLIASRHHALVLYNGYIFLLKPGALLPDGSSIVALQSRQGAWQMVNSDGIRFEPRGSSERSLGS